MPTIEISENNLEKIRDILGEKFENQIFESPIVDQITFKQITAGQDGRLYGLDVNGEVWEKNYDKVGIEDCWTKMLMKGFIARLSQRKIKIKEDKKDS